MVLVVLGSDGTTDQFWQAGAKDHMRMWTDQFLEEGDEYFSSMSSFMTNQFNPEFQFMSGVPNPTVGAPSLSSSSRLQRNPADVLKQLYKLTGDCNYNAFKDCHHKDAFLQHANETCQAKTEPSIKLSQPFAGMAASS